MSVSGVDESDFSASAEGVSRESGVDWLPVGDAVSPSDETLLCVTEAEKVDDRGVPAAAPVSPGKEGGWDIVMTLEMDVRLDGSLLLLSDQLCVPRSVLRTGSSEQATHSPLRAASKKGDAKCRTSLCAQKVVASTIILTVPGCAACCEKVG